MRRFTITCALIIPMILLGLSSTTFAQTTIEDWGAVGSRLSSSGWTLDNTASTTAGDVHLSGPGSTSSSWSAVRGAFADTVDLTVGQTLIVRGSFEIDGSLEGWNPIRVGVYDHRDLGTLNYQNTDSAQWGYTQYAGTDSATFVSNESAAYGYLVTNQVGTNGGIGGQGGNNTAWAVNGGSWISTWSGGTMGIGETVQSPRRAIMPAGTYDFEFAVTLSSDTTSDFNWYIMNQDGASYLQSGTHTNNFMYVGTDSSTAITSFNGFAFSHQGGDDATVTAIDFTGVEYEVGTTSITIPEPIFSSFYIDQWGASGTRLAGSGWTLDNDSTTLVGDAYLSGPGSTSASWTAIRGGFGSLPVTATLDEAVIVSGEFEINGDLTGWNPLRFGIYNFIDGGTLHNQYTDSAIWGYTQYEGTDSAAFVSSESTNGYLITNQVGTNGLINGQGGSGSAWAVNGGSWLSTWSGGTMQLGVTDQSPRRANMVAGTYEFEMSVQPMADGTTEFRWYIMHEDGESYLQGGVHTDTTAQVTSFNGFAFSHQGGDEAEVTEFNLYAVQVDRGAPIEIPEPIFSSFYIDEWGASGTRLAGSGWTLDNDSTTLVGDAYLSGPGSTSASWTAIRGGFGSLPVTATLDEAVIVSGEFEINGDLTGWNPLRFGIYNFIDGGTLHNQYTDSAIWGYTQYEGTDSAAFVSSESTNGYLITNQVGTNGLINGQGGSGSAWAVNGGSWLSTWSGGTMQLGVTDQSPRRANMVAGTYEFEMSVQPMADGTTEFRWYIMHEDGESYLQGGVHTDTTAQVTSFNGFAFSHQGGDEAEVTEFNLYAVQVDRGDPIEVPAPIFSSFYADTWGFLGGKLGGASETDSAWALTPGQLVGDASFGGSAAAGWANVAADFGIPVTPKADEAIKITADITFEGGGFDAGSFKIGLFNAALGSRDSTDKVGYVFTGSDVASGYVVTPTASSSTIGYVNDGPWYEADGSVSDHTAAGTTAAGTYELTLAVGPASSGGVWVAAKLEGDDFKYEVDGVDANGTVASYTALILGTNSSSVTGITVEAMEIDIIPANEVTIDIENEDTGLPTEFNISQNYPNPFNPTTQIEFAVPQTSNVTLKVYDVMGRLVQTLVDGNRSAGRYSVTFNANNLASGVYFYRMEAGSFVQMKQMMLIK